MTFFFHFGHIQSQGISTARSDLLNCPTLIKFQLLFEMGRYPLLNLKWALPDLLSIVQHWRILNPEDLLCFMLRCFGHQVFLLTCSEEP